MVKKIYLIFLVISMLITVFSASTVVGSMYSPDLTMLNNCILVINSSPVQTIVINNNTYNIQLNQGLYKFEINCVDNNEIYLDEEIINITEDNSKYHIDFITLPDLSSPILDNLNFSDINVNTNKEISQNSTKTFMVTVLFSILLVLSFVLIIYFLLKPLFFESTKNKKEIKELNEDLLLILKLLKENNCRATQKNLRNLLNWTESRMSLAITELESYNYITRIKKGRGNIIILNDKKLCTSSNSI